jgi:hypothetical protein
MLCRSSFVLLAIVLSVLLWYTDSDYHFSIFKLFLIRPTWMQWLYKVRLIWNDMNCLLFRIVFQRFFRLNQNSCFCVWDLLCLLVFFPVFFRSCFVFSFICFLLGGCCGAWPVCVVFYLFFAWWVLRCLTGLCCLSLDFLVFILFFFSKQLVINSYMPFYHNIIGF